MQFPLPRRFFAHAARWAWLLVALQAGASWSAAPLPQGVELGMTVEQLRRAVPAARAMSHPSRMTGSLVGSWTGPAVDFAGLGLTPTFFFADGELRRVEYVGTPADAAADFAKLRSWGRAQWGAALDSDSPDGAYAAWVGDDFDAYVQSTSSARPQLRLVIKRRVAKDAGEL